MAVTVLLHPAMTGAEAHAWCQRHGRELEVTHKQGKVHLLVVATPRPGAYTCIPCGWSGNDPKLIDAIYYPGQAHTACPSCGVFVFHRSQTCPSKTPESPSP